MAESRVVRTLARIALVAALAALLLAPAIGGRVGSVLFVVASLVVPGALLVSSGRTGGRIAAALILTLLLEGGALALLASPGRPAAAWIMLGVLGLAPLVAIPALHAARAEPEPPERS